MWKDLFSLKPSDRFKLSTSDEIFTVKEYTMKYRPTLGKVPHLIAYDLKGKEAWFTTNFKVKLEEDKDE